MILGVDIGNTTIEIGYIESLDNIQSMKFKTDPEKTPDDWIVNIDFFNNFFKIKKSMIKEILISSVVPQMDSTIRIAFLKYYDKNPVFVGKDINVPIKINYEDPSQVGVDRIINSYGSLNITKPPIICVDFGTAITFDIVNKNSEYDGGLIFPGIEASLKCLFSKTAKLPKVNLERPPTVVGKNTVNSIQSGLYYGYLSLVEGVIDKIEKYYNQKFNLVVTGGNSYIIVSDLKKKFIFEPKLPLKGLFYLAKTHLR